MGFLAAAGYDGAETIHLGSGYWVRVKKCLTEAEMSRVEALLGGGRQRVEITGESRFGEVDLHGSRVELVVASIIDWNIDGPPVTKDGAQWPLEPGKGPWSPGCQRRQSVAALPAPVFQAIWERCDELNAHRDSTEQAQFRDRSGGGDQDGGQRPANAPEVPAGTGDVAGTWPAGTPYGGAFLA